MTGETRAKLMKLLETQYEKKINFIVMSGHAGPAAEKNGIDVASYSFLRKPLSIQNLLEKVASVLEVKNDNYH